MATPTVTRKEVPVPSQRPLGGSRWTAIAVTAVLGGVLGGLMAGPVFALICIAWLVTLTVLLLELSAAYSEAARRPKFSLRALFLFTTACAFMLLIVRIVSPRNIQWLFSWYVHVHASALAPLLSLPFQLAAWTWCFVVPAGLVLTAIGTIRHRPAPIFSYVFVTSGLAFLTLLVLVVAARNFRPLAHTLSCAAIMLIAAVGFVVECRMRSDDSQHHGRAIIAVLTAVHNYVAIVGMLGSMYWM